MDALRPCVGSNECLHRGLVDGMRFSCAVNPSAGHELVEVEPASEPRRVLVVGGGPAGLETAALASERGHDVTLWEREPVLGGQLAIAAHAPAHGAFAAFIVQQARRLGGATVELGREANADDVVAFGADVVVIATGAAPRVPDVPGAELAVGVRDVLMGAEVGRAGGADRRAPTTPSRCSGPTSSPRAGRRYASSTRDRSSRRWSASTASAATWRGCSRPAWNSSRCSGWSGSSRAPPARSTSTPARRWSTRPTRVVLAYGGHARTELHAALEGRVDELHILGDAWAPRRLTIATRQAWELARAL